MFGKAKEQLDFVKKARQIQKKLKEEVITVESGAVTIVINGEQKIQRVSINEEDVDPNNLGVLEKDIKTAIESAIKRSQDVAASLMKDMGGFGGLPGM